jgi:hypothetical protein
MSELNVENALGANSEHNCTHKNNLNIPLPPPHFPSKKQTPALGFNLKRERNSWRKCALNKIRSPPSDTLQKKNQIAENAACITISQ